MNAAAFLILTASLAGAPAPQDSRQLPRTQRDRPHQFGVGASLGISNRGGGAALRYWFGDHVGVDLQASWYRPYQRTTTTQGTTLSRTNTFHVLPSVLINLKKPNQDAELDLRPYVGGGLNYLNSRRPAPLSSLDQRTNGVGGQAFGGVEMTFREAPNMTLSVEGIYYKLPGRTFNAQVIDGFNYLVAFHYYLK